MRQRGAVLRLGLLLACALAAAGASAEDQPAPSDTTRVAYVSGSVVYLEAGRLAGLREGDRVEVVRDGKSLGQVTIEHLSSRRAAAALPTEAFTVRSGDLIRFHPHPAEAFAPPAGPETVPSAQRPRSRGWFRDRGLRGRIGARLLASRGDGEGTLGYTQPSLDLRLDGTGVAGTPIDFNLDARSRRTFFESDRASRDVTKIYRLAIARRGTTRVTIGRQSSSALGAIGAFDGLSLERVVGGWSLGGLSGTQPDPLNYGLSSEVWEHGLFARWEQVQSGGARQQLVVGLVGAYRKGQVDREFVALQGRLDGPRAALSLSQDLDLNRGWKAAAGEPSVSLTSSAAYLRVRVRESLAWSIGYDNRRSVRLYRDRVTPETDFYDRYRQGGSLRLEWEPAPARHLSLEARNSRSGGRSTASTWSAMGTTPRLGSLPVSLRARSTYFDNDAGDGWLQSLTAGSPIGSRMNLDLEAGTRTDRSGSASSANRTWFGLDLDAALSHHLYLLLTEERETGGGDRADRIFASLSWRF